MTGLGNLAVFVSHFIHRQLINRTLGSLGSRLLTTVRPRSIISIELNQKLLRIYRFSRGSVETFDWLAPGFHPFFPVSSSKLPLEI